MNKNDNIEAFPTQGGSFTGYEVQIKTKDESWRLISTREYKQSLGEVPFPYPEANRGLLMQISMMGYSQAMAVAWYIKSASEYQQAIVRVVPYKIGFDIKCYSNEVEATYIGEGEF